MSARPSQTHRSDKSRMAVVINVINTVPSLPVKLAAETALVQGANIVAPETTVTAPNRVAPVERCSQGPS